MSGGANLCSEGTPGCHGTGALGHCPLWCGERKGSAQSHVPWGAGCGERLAPLTARPPAQPSGLGHLLIHLSDPRSVPGPEGWPASPPGPCPSAAPGGFSLLTSSRGRKSGRAPPGARWRGGLGTFNVQDLPSYSLDCRERPG